MSRHEFADSYLGLGYEFSADAWLAGSNTVVPLCDGGDDGVGIFGPMEGARVVVGPPRGGVMVLMLGGAQVHCDADPHVADSHLHTTKGDPKSGSTIRFYPLE